MSDFVVINGDTAIFEPTFGAAELTVSPGTITGSGEELKVAGKTACVEGDEASVEVQGCAYNTVTFPTPGLGTITISSLASDQTAQKLTVGGKKAILVGSKFTAKFTVDTAASNPNAPDTILEYSGSGSFITNNAILRSRLEV